MARNTSVTLGSHFDDFVAQCLKDGRYESASEVVRAGLRLLEDSETKVEALRLKLAEAKSAGTTKYSYKEFLNEVDNEIDID